MARFRFSTNKHAPRPNTEVLLVESQKIIIGWRSTGRKGPLEGRLTQKPLDTMNIPTTKYFLSTAEKVLVVKVYEYFTNEKQKKRTGYRIDTRNGVSECLGFSTATISRIMADWNKYRDPSFPARDSDGAPLDKSVLPTRGHRVRLDEVTYAEDIRTIILDKHSNAKPITAAIIRQELM